MRAPSRCWLGGFAVPTDSWRDPGCTNTGRSWCTVYRHGRHSGATSGGGHGDPAEPVAAWGLCSGWPTLLTPSTNLFIEIYLGYFCCTSSASKDSQLFALWTKVYFFGLWIGFGAHCGCLGTLWYVISIESCICTAAKDNDMHGLLFFSSCFSLGSCSGIISPFATY